MGCLGRGIKALGVERKNTEGRSMWGCGRGRGIGNWEKKKP
jgi:hypothetical protein